MSIKDLFNKKIVTQNTITELTNSVESIELIKEVEKRNRTFFPNLDFADPASFVHFGSAKEYYTSAIKRIYSSFPYDGSETEKLRFKNNSTYLDQWMLENKYPRSTGYALFSANGWGTGTTINSEDGVAQYGLPDYVEYIYSAGGTHSASIEQHTESANVITEGLAKAFEKAVIYDTDKNRTTNFRMKMDDGISIQFWLKKEAFDISKTKKEIILDLWNGNASSSSGNIWSSC